MMFNDWYIVYSSDNIVKSSSAGSTEDLKIFLIYKETLDFLLKKMSGHSMVNSIMLWLHSWISLLNKHKFS